MIQRGSGLVSDAGIVLLGPPGAGKSTQAAAIAAGHGGHPLSIGELLRAEARRDAVTAGIIERGEFVSDDTALGLLGNAVASSPGLVLLDGFPRTGAQARGLATLGPRFRSARVVVLVVDEPTIMDRLSSRSRSQGRSDDHDPEVIRRRIELFHHHLRGVLAACAEGGHRVEMVDGSPEPDEVTHRVVRLLAGDG